MANFLFKLLKVEHIDKSGPFIKEKSDGCSVISRPYRLLTGKELTQVHCCYDHDEAYWYGGTHQQRLEADRMLRRCVAKCGDNIVERLAFFIAAWVMFIAVRIGGSHHIPHPRVWQRNDGSRLREALINREIDNR